MENFLTSLRNRVLLLVVVIGLIFIGIGVFIYKSQLIFSGEKVEVLSESVSSESDKELTVETVGQVIRPGVYKLPYGSRIDDLLVIAGGLTVNADRLWVEKYVNRAARLTDGQKVYIPKISEQSQSPSANRGGGDQSVSAKIPSDSNALININSASLSQLDSLPGIGQIYGQSIIEHRPYSDVEELMSKGVLKKSVYEKIKELISVY